MNSSSDLVPDLPMHSQRQSVRIGYLGCLNPLPQEHRSSRNFRIETPNFVSMRKLHDQDQIKGGGNPPRKLCCDMRGKINADFDRRFGHPRIGRRTHNRSQTGRRYFEVRAAFAQHSSAQRRAADVSHANDEYGVNHASPFVVRILAAAKDEFASAGGVAARVDAAECAHLTSQRTAAKRKNAAAALKRLGDLAVAMRSV
jgi:hypothetical protein